MLHQIEINYIYIIVFYRFFSRKREGASSGDRGKTKAKTPEPDRMHMSMATPKSRALGSNTMLQRSPTIKPPQVNIGTIVASC